MKRRILLIFEMLLLVLMVARPSAISAQTLAPDAAVPHSPQQRLIQSEIAKFPNGHYLYHHSEIFEHWIESRCEESEELLISGVEEHESSYKEGSPLNTVGARDLTDEVFQSEASVAISRTDPKLMVVGANDEQMFKLGMPAYVTQDAGQTWTTVRLPKARVTAYKPGGDPMVVASQDGNIYYAYLSYDQADASHKVLSDIQLARTTDGIHWVLCTPVVGRTARAASLEDKESIAVDNDPASRFFGRIYATWLHFSLDGSEETGPRVAWSDDQGATWSAPTELDPETGDYATIRVGALGTVMIASSSNTTDGPMHSMLTSFDGGRTFKRHDIAAFNLFPSNASGHSCLKGTNGIRAFPYIAFDVSRKGNLTYAIYGSWDSSANAARQYLVKSWDDGTHWSEPLKILDPGFTSCDRFFPWVACDQDSGTPWLCYFSSAEDPSNRRCRMEQQSLLNPGYATPIGTHLFNPAACISNSGEAFIGDYVGADACQGYYISAWAENQEGSKDADIYAYITTPVGSVGVGAVIKSGGVIVGNISPNPATSSMAKLFLELDRATAIGVDVIDSRGVVVRTVPQREVMVGETSLTVDLSGLPSGVYQCDVRCGSTRIMRSVVIEH